MRDTAESIRADRQLREGVPNDPDNDLAFHQLVLIATRDEETARRSLYNRIRNRRIAQTEGVR